ncbi:MAG TPA: nucleotide pyrophosphohydrolase [Tepidisphaeraceae bacterium]|nr:nucleotide pyrophosphohydrolase [Tepidisphaeraceae bacterium]
MPQHTVEQLTRRVLEHRDERQWAQFHTPKELAISLCVKSAELLSLMQWKSEAQVAEVIRTKRAQIQDELADVLHSVLLLASDLNVNLAEVLEQKLLKDAQKYPVNKAKGRNAKYDEL